MEHPLITLGYVHTNQADPFKNAVFIVVWDVKTEIYECDACGSQGKARQGTFIYKARLKQPLLTKVPYSQFKKYEIHKYSNQHKHNISTS